MKAHHPVSLLEVFFAVFTIYLASVAAPVISPIQIVPIFFIIMLCTNVILKGLGMFYQFIREGV